MDNKYAHILNLPHHTSQTRPRMSASRRAAQFAPFAALTGYEAVIEETARQTEQAVFLDEGEVAGIDRCLQALKEEIGLRPPVRVRFFLPDRRKAGGSYQTIHGRVIKIDENLQKMVLESGEIILFQHIVQLFRE